MQRCLLLLVGQACADARARSHEPLGAPKKKLRGDAVEPMVFCAQHHARWVVRCCGSPKSHRQPRSSPQKLSAGVVGLNGIEPKERGGPRETRQRSLEHLNCLTGGAAVFGTRMAWAGRECRDTQGALRLLLLRWCGCGCGLNMLCVALRCVALRGRTRRRKNAKS